MKKVFVIYILFALNLSNTSDTNYQEILQGFKDLQKTSEKGLLTPLFSPRKLAKIRKNRKGKGP